MSGILTFSTIPMVSMMSYVLVVVVDKVEWKTMGFKLVT